MSTPDESAVLWEGESLYGREPAVSGALGRESTGSEAVGRETLSALHHEVELELGTMTTNEPDLAAPVSEWLVDPMEVERDEVALRSLLGAVEALESDAEARGE
jgi:hypothetical protein